MSIKKEGVLGLSQNIHQQDPVDGWEKECLFYQVKMVKTIILKTK